MTSEPQQLSYRLRSLLELLELDRLVIMPLLLSLLVRSAWVSAVVGTVTAVVIHRIHSQRLVVRPVGLVIRTTFRTHRVPFSEVKSLAPWLLLRSGKVLHLPRPPLAGSALEEFEMFVHRHAPDVEVRSSGVSRWERQSAGPADSLRSLRTARAGRWRLTVKPVHGGYQAGAQTCLGPPASRLGTVRSTLSEATDDAIEMIEVLRNE